MKKSQIIFSQYSPLMAVDTELVGTDQQTIDTPRVCSLCRCGESENKPLCDGTHAQVGFDGMREDSDKKELEYYRGREITIVFDRYLCMGAGYCGELEAVLARMMNQSTSRMQHLLKTLSRPLKSAHQGP
jgi:CDGSH-type Zn-finger protein